MPRRPTRIRPLASIALLCVAAIALAGNAGADSNPTKVLEDRCGMACRAAATPVDVCSARCRCVAQGFQLGLEPAEIPRWIAALDGSGPQADAARKRWADAEKSCASLQSPGGY